MNKLVTFAIVLAIISVISFILPIHPVFGIAGFTSALFSAGFGFAKMEEAGLLG